MNALPFRPGMIGERTWQLQDALLREQGRAGLNCLTGGPGLDYPYPSPGDPDARIAARVYLKAARRYGTIRAVVPYGGFLPSLKRATYAPSDYTRGISRPSPTIPRTTSTPTMSPAPTRSCARPSSARAPSPRPGS